MIEYRQRGFNSTRVPESAVGLRSPLRAVWDLKGDFGNNILAVSHGVLTWSIDGALSFISRDGNHVWRVEQASTGWHGIVGNRVVALAEREKRKRLLDIDIDDGRVLRDEACDFKPCVFLAGVEAFIGARVHTIAGDEQVSVACVETEGRRGVRWVREPDSRDAKLADGEFGTDVCATSTRVFVAKGSSLVALDTEAGAVMWQASVSDMGGMPWAGRCDPMIAEDIVVISTARGTAAFSAATGRRVWTRDASGPRVVADSVVHMCTSRGRYMEIELRTGKPLVEVDLPSRIQSKWGIGDVYLATGLTVGEREVFVGDGVGRLHAIERHTGAATWLHEPRGSAGYFGVQPAVAGQRMYLCSVSNPKKVGGLYAYESS